MMQFLRNGSQSGIIKFFLFGMLGFAMMGLVVMDVGGVFRSGVPNGAIAKVGKSEISVAAFDRSVQMVLQQQKIPAEDIYKSGILKSVLNNEIEKRLFIQASADMGLRVNDVVVAKRITDILKPLTNQDIAKADAMQRLLYSQGNISEESLVAQLKQETAMDQLLNAVIGGTYVPEQMIDDAYRSQHEMRDIKYIKVLHADIKNLKAPSNEQLETYYKSVSAQYKTPEYRGFSYIVLSNDIISKDLIISDDELADAYAEQEDDFTTPERRKMTQAILSDEDSAKEVIKQINDGVALDKAVDGQGTVVATKNYAKSDLPEELAEIVFNAEKGNIPTPVESSFGWHVLVLEDILAEETQSFEQVKANIKQELLLEKSDNILFETISELEDLSSADTPLSDIATELSLPVKIVKSAQITDKLDLPKDSNLLQTVFTLNPDEHASLIETKAGAFILVGLDDVKEAQVKDFDTVRAEVLKQWYAQKRHDLTRQKALDLFAKMQDGASLSSVAKTAGHKIKTVTGLKRFDTDTDKKLDNGLVTAGFTLTILDNFMRLPTKDGEVLVELSKTTLPDPKEMSDKDRKQLKHLLTGAAQKDALEQYKQTLIKEMGVTINERVLNSMYKQDAQDNTDG